jgi:hypothetical protein
MSRRWRWTLGALALLIVLVIAGPILAERPLRRVAERQVNACVEGYTAQIGGLDVRPLTLSVHLRDLYIAQDANPDPPLVRIPRVSTDLRLAPLLLGRLVASVLVVEAQVDASRAQVVRAMESASVVMKDCTLRKMLDVVHAIDLFRLRDATVDYVDHAGARPLTVRALNVDVRDIRLEGSGPDVGPSPLTVEAVVFDDGRLRVDGAADLLREPYPAFKGRLEVAGVALDRLGSLAAPYGLDVSRGTLGFAGGVEYSPDVKVVDLEYVSMDGLQADYVYRKVSGQAVKETVKEAADKAQQVINAPRVRLAARRISLEDATLGFVNEDAQPRYRVYLSDIDAQMENFSNQLTEGTMTARVTARFMGSGETAITATIRPEADGPDFDLSTRIEQLDVRRLNDLLRAHGKIDVASGLVSVYSELHVKNGRVDGYVKPLIRDLKVYEPRQDREKSVGQKLKEKAANIVSKLLRNRPHQDIATVAPIAGPLENPKADTWATMVNLVQNAFFRAILPGFVEDEAGPGR